MSKVSYFSKKWIWVIIINSLNNMSFHTAGRMRFTPLHSWLISVIFHWMMMKVKLSRSELDNLWRRLLPFKLCVNVGRWISLLSNTLRNGVVSKRSSVWQFDIPSSPPPLALLNLSMQWMLQISPFHFKGGVEFIHRNGVLKKYTIAVSTTSKCDQSFYLT